MTILNATLLFVLAAAPARAQTPAAGTAEACKTLEAKARALKAPELRCDATAAALIVSGVPEARLRELEKQGLFPQRRFLGYPVVNGKSVAAATQAPAAPSLAVLTAEELALKAAQARVLTQAVAADFDNAVARRPLAAGPDESLRDSVASAPAVKADMATGRDARLVLAQQGPPGSAGGPPGSGQPQDTTRRGGPPGSGGQNPPRSGPPGSGGQNPPRSGPPGSGNPPDRTPPGGG
ncbi:MAG: hypothetical protein NUW21_06865, partial [Elusimicrobia bacterium]|nr:hypothetical protein [Elusimicrobiota bacterium]